LAAVFLEYYQARTHKDVEYAIADMVVRGAPAIGAVAAYGVYLAAMEYRDLPREEFLLRLKEANRILAASRPTAVNLMWAIERMERLLTRLSVYCQSLSKHGITLLGSGQVEHGNMGPGQEGIVEGVILPEEFHQRRIYYLVDLQA